MISDIRKQVRINEDILKLKRLEQRLIDKLKNKHLSDNNKQKLQKFKTSNDLALFNSQ